MKDVRIVFMGTPEFSVPSLKILNENFNVVLVVCQPDKPSNRGIVRFNPVKQYAIDNNIKVFQPTKIKEDYSLIKEANPDIIITCAYGQIIPDEILKLPKYGCVNIHASLLPKLRGGAPIHRAIIDGYDKSGITIMNMISKMDAGDIILQESIPILDNDNVGTLHDKLSILGKDTLENVLKSIFNKTNTRIKQGDNYTLAPMLTREDEHIDFNNNGRDIINKIRAFNPWPLANIIIDNKEIKVIEAKFVKKDVNIVGEIVDITKDKLGISCNDGIIYLEKIKPMGKKEMDIKSFLNGIDKKGG